MSRGRRRGLRPGCGKCRGRFVGKPAWSPDAALGAAGSRPRDRSERLLLLFAAEKQKKEKEGGIEKGLLGLSSLIWVEVKSSRLCHGAKKQLPARVRKASGKVCRKTAQSPDAAHRAAGSRPRDGSERLLLLFGGEKLKKTDEIAAASGKLNRCAGKRCRCRRLTPHDGRMDVALRPPGHQLAPLGVALDVAGNVAALGSYPQPLRANLREHSLRQLCGNALPLEAGWHPRVQQVQRVTPAQVVDDGLLPVAQVERVALPCRVVSKRISFHGVVFVGS